MCGKILIIENAPARSEGFVEAFEENHTEVDIVRIHRHEVLPLPEDYDGIVSSGGPLSICQVDEPEYAFLGKECEFLLQAIERNVPVLGVCFGHQLLAHALNGVVGPAELPEFGWMSVDLTSQGKEDPLFYGVGQEFSSFQYHNDEVKVLPEGAMVLATSDSVPVQAFRFRDQLAWGIQFHPEVSLAMSEEILETRKGVLEERGLQFEAMITRSREVAGEERLKIFSNFVNILTSR